MTSRCESRAKWTDRTC